MASKLPSALQNLKLEFEPLDSKDVDYTPCDAREENSKFAKRVESLAYEYLSRRQLFIQTASLKGPFDGAWADSNPWISRPIRISSFPQIDNRPTIRSATLKSSLTSGPTAVLKSYSGTNVRQARNVTQDAEEFRHVKRRRKDHLDIEDQHDTSQLSFQDFRKAHNGVLLPRAMQQDGGCESYDPSTSSHQPTTPGPLLGGKEFLERGLGPPYDPDTVEASTGSGSHNLLTPSDSEHASPCYIDQQTNLPQYKGASSKRFAPGKAPDRTDGSNNVATKLEKPAAEMETASSRRNSSQTLPSTISPLLCANNARLPSTLPTMDSIKANEARHKKTMEKIFPRPINELERAVGEWAFELRPSPRCKKEAFMATVRPSSFPMENQSSDNQADQTGLKPVESKTKKQHLNKPDGRRRFMTFDTPRGFTKETHGNMRLNTNNQFVVGGKASTFEKIRDQSSRSPKQNENPVAPSCVSSSKTTRHDDGFAALDRCTNTVLSPAEAVQAKRVARKSGASLSNIERGPANSGADTTKDASPYVSTQVQWEQAYWAFQEGLLSPAKQVSPERGSERAGTVHITPFSRFESPSLRAPPPVHEIQLDDEVQVMNTQELFDAVPVFSNGSTRKASFGPYEQNEDMVGQSFGSAADVIREGDTLQPVSRPQSSHVNPRSIMKKAVNDGVTLECETPHNIDMDLWLSEAESFLAPFDIEVEMNKVGQGTPILSQ